jgi:glutaredoxin
MSIFHISALLSIIFLVTIQPAFGEIFLKDGTLVPPDSILETITNSSETASHNPFPIQFFFTSGCGSCNDARDYLKTFERKNPGIAIESHNLAYNAENRQLFTEYKTQFHNPDIPYPVIFLGNIGVSGSSDIIHHTKTIVAWYQGL